MIYAILAFAICFIFLFIAHVSLWNDVNDLREELKYLRKTVGEEREKSKRDSRILKIVTDTFGLKAIPFGLDTIPVKLEVWNQLLKELDLEWKTEQAGFKKITPRG